ncbi:MAG: serine/threonine protein kinase [Myxococcales bacterium]|nr:MAG: serine/threonine protein kinase [Myxococcales bacterium]
MSGTVSLPTGLPDHLRPGLMIAGKYRLEEEIGRGAMGVVYRAVHFSLGQRVAIKLISSEHSQSAEARARFSVEAKAAAKLRSRHVVQVIDDGETPEGNPYIVLEYLEGETLEQRLEREHDVPLADAVRIVTHVGRALARAHAEGIVHRDLKPANIFLVQSEDEDAGWVAKVLDFGIAKIEHGEKGTTQAGTVLGTPLFMSPEQVRGASSVDHRADLYSLGMCLFHMLTGDYAHYSPNYSEILVSICTLPLPRLRAKAPWLPEAVEHWFQRACAREPLERFQSADEMTEALQAACGASPPSKHQSVPEGRIAPETLVGFAAPPAVANLQAEGSPLGLARTQALSSEGVPAPGAITAPIAIAIHSEPRARAITGEEWTPPPRRKLAAWVAGAVIGLTALALLGIVLRFVGAQEPALEPGSAAAPPSASPSREPASRALASAPWPAPAPTPEPVSSVAAEGATSSAAPLRAAEAPKKRAKGGVTAPAPIAPASKAVGSDLGF